MTVQYYQMAAKGRGGCLNCSLPGDACYVDYRCPFSTVFADPAEKIDRKMVEVSAAIAESGPMSMSQLAAAVGVTAEMVSKWAKADRIIISPLRINPGRSKIVTGVK